MRVSGFMGFVGATTLAGALLASAAPAVADISYTSYSVTNDVNVTLTCSASITGCVSGYYGSGQINIYNGPTLEAQIWCVDVTHDLQGSSSSGHAFNVTSFMAVTSGSNGLSNIWSGGAAGLGTQLKNGVVGELGALAYYGDTHISSYYVSSAVQLAIWDIEYNHGALNLNGAGNALKEVSDAAHTEWMAETLVKEVQLGWLGSDTDVDWLTCGTSAGACNQGQIEAMGMPPKNVVPEPSSLALFGSALIGLAGFLSFRARRT